MGSYLDYAKKKRNGGGAAASSSSAGYAKYASGKRIGLDTFESDLNNVNTTLNSIMGEWQTTETMANTKTAIESMYKRIDAYQNYQKKYEPDSKTNITEIANAYKTALDNWEGLSKTYGYYQDADSYNKAMKQASLAAQLKGKTYEEVQAEKAKYAKDSDEYKYLDTYTGYSDLNDYDKAIQNASDKTYLKSLEAAKNIHSLDNPLDKYKHYMESEDFAEMSQYQKSDKKGIGNWIKDSTHEFINEDKGIETNYFAQSVGERLDMLRQGIFGGGTSAAYMTDEERNLYNFFYNKKMYDELDNYMRDMEVTLSKRKNAETEQAIGDAVDSTNIAGKISLAAVAPAWKVAGNVMSTADNLNRSVIGLFDKNVKTNPYGAAHTLANVGNKITETTAENIAEATQGDELAGMNIPSFLYTQADSMVTSALSRLTAGGNVDIASLIQAGGAFGSKLRDAKEKGANELEAVGSALSAGAWEFIGERVTHGKLNEIGKVDSLKAFLKSAGVQVWNEGVEELATEALNIVSDTVIRQGNSDVVKAYEEYLDRGFTNSEALGKVAVDLGGQLGWAFAGGALSGGVMGGVTSANNYNTLKSTGEQIRTSERTQDMFDLQGLTAEESEAYKLYTEYANKGITADNIKDAQLGNLYTTVAEENMNTLRSKSATEEEAQRAYTALDKLNSVTTPRSKEEKAVQQNLEKLNKGAATVDASGNEVKLEGIKTEGGETVLVTSEGEVSASDMTFANKDAEIVAYAQSMTEEKANAFIAQYDGKADVDAYAKSFELAYTYGEAAMDNDVVLANKGVLTESQALEAYKAGIQNRAVVQQKAIDEITKKYSSNKVVRGTFNDSIIDYTNATTDDSKVNWNQLTKRQRVALNFAAAFTEATGVNIELIKSTVVDKETGKRAGEHGHYNAETNTIAIDVYAGIMDAQSVNDSIIPTLSHEVTHWMKAKAPAMYAKMKDYILETLTLDGKNTVNDLIAERKVIMLRNHPDAKVTDEDAIDELIARGSEDMLANSDAIRKMFNRMSKTEKDSFVAKIKDTVNNLMEWVNKLLSKYKSTSKEAEVLRQYKARLKELSKMWDKTLKEAIKVDQSMQWADTTAEKVLKSKTEFQWADREKDAFEIDATIEQTEDMIAVHNLSEEKLLKTIQLGGFPMPSIAVTKASIGHKGFGSISLLFRKETIDPKFFRNNRVYSGDAWTPTYPKIDFKPNEKVVKKISDKYYELSDKFGYDNVRALFSYATNMPDALDNEGGETGLLEKLYKDTKMMQVYLQDAGKGKVAPIEKEVRKEITKEEAAANQAFIDALDAEILAEFEIPKDASPLEYRKEFLAKYRNEIDEAYKKVLTEHYELTEEEAKAELAQTKPMKMLGIIRRAYQYTKDKGISISTETDIAATNEAIRNAAADGYKEWVDSLFKGVEAGRGIRNSKPIYTPSGNRRSWDTLHYEETLENVIKAMREDGEKGLGLGGGNIFGASTIAFDSIDSIKEAGKNLRSIPQDEWWKVKEEFQHRFHVLASSLPNNKNSFTAADDAASILVEAIVKYNTRAGIANYLKKELKGWANYSEQVVDDFLELVNDIRNMPVNYFEAKPLRAVGFDEVAYAVIPDNASEKVRTELGKLSIPMKEYKAGDEDARVEAVNSIEGIQFSDRDSDGNQLTKEQTEYFKDSKVRDESGRLKVMYHGTPNAGFTEFKSGTYFTEHKWYAEAYQSQGASSLSYKQSADNPDTYAVYLNIKKPFDTRNKAERDIFYNEYYRQWGTGTDLMESGLPDWLDGMDLQEFIEEMGYDYDGLILDEGGVGGYGDEVVSRGLSYVIFNPEQVKNIDNTKPTSNPDIRYSDRETKWTLKEYSEKQLENWKGSRRIVVYENDAQLMEFVNDAVSSGTFNKKMYFGMVSDELADEMSSRFNVDVHDFNVSLSGNELRKILKDHGSEATEAPRGQRAVQKEDFAYIPYVMEKPTEIEYGGLFVGKPLYNFKREGYTVAGVVSDKHLDLFVQTMYVNKKNRSLATATDEQASVNTSETTSGTASRDSIAHSEENATEIKRFSDREEELYDIMGENEALKKQNAKLAEDVERLKERIRLEKKVTKGNTFNANQLRSVAKYLLKTANSTYSEDKLIKGLKDVYSYIVETPNLDWNDLMFKSYGVAKDILEEQRETKATDHYFKAVLDDIRKAKISLDEQQIAEAKHAFGNNYHRAFFGKIQLTKNGIKLDSKWQEWASLYPEIFDADTSPNDQIVALYDIYDSVRDSATVYQKYNDEESIRELAVEIYNQYWNVSTIRTTADKYDKEIKRLNFEHRKAIKELREDYKNRLAEQKKADDIYYGRIINSMRERKERQVQDAREFGRRRLNEYRDRAERNAKIQKITKNALTLNKWLVTNSKKAHVPEPLKPIVTNFLNAIDFSSKRMLETGVPTQNDERLSKALSKVHRMMLDSNNTLEGESGGQYFGTIFAPDFVKQVGELVDRVENFVPASGEYVLNQMSLEDLKVLDMLVAVLKSSVVNMNKFFVLQHSEGIANFAQKGILYRDKLGTAKEYRGFVGAAHKTVTWNNTVPYYAFKRFGEDGAKVFEAFQDGWDKFAFNTKQITDYANEAYSEKEIAEWSDDIKEVKISGDRTVKMTIPQIMSLYELQKREQARKHLYGKGMRIANIEKGIVVGRSPKGTGKLTQTDIDTITGTLTDRQKVVADKLQEFMNTVSSEWGNEVTMKLYGFRGFEEKNYFPIKADDNNLVVEAKDNENSIFRLLNMSFTKSINEHATNRIIVSDIFEVFAQHTSDMAKYNALALPVYDAFKWYSYKEETDDNTMSVKESLEAAFGKDGKNYAYTFLKDINGAANVSRDSISHPFFTNAKTAAVGANLKVIALQPTSYLRASAVIDTKYLTQALTRKPKIALAEKYCGIAQWKSLGFYDTNIQKGVTELIKHNKTMRDKLIEKSMKGAEWADKVTWGYLWNASEAEVRDKRKDLKAGSEEFYKAVGLRLREIIYSTQVVDSTMTRSQIMRSSDSGDKGLTSFMSEPTLAFNMLQDVYMDWKLTERETGSKEKAFNKHGKKLARTFTAYTVTNIVAALVESGFEAFRDNDKDELTEEEIIKDFLQNFALNMGIVGKIPYVKEIISYAQGYSSSRTDMQWMQYFVYTLTGIGKLMEGEGNVYKTAKNAIRAASQLSGIPVYNVLRDFEALLETLELWFNGTIGGVFPSLK